MASSRACPEEKAVYMEWSMRVFIMNKVSTDARNSTFMSRTHPLELEVCERIVLRAASPVSPRN